MRFYQNIFTLTLILIPVLSFGQIDYKVADIPEQLLADANSTVIEHKVEIDIPNNRKIISCERRVITVHNKAGDRHVDAYVNYDNETKVKSLRVDVVDANGNLLETFRKRDFEDVSAVSGGTLYSDSRVLFLNYTPTSYPYTVIFESVVESDNTFFIPRWTMYQNTYSSIWNKYVRIKYEPSLGLRYKTFDPKGQFEVEEQEGFLKISVREQGVIKTEEMSPSFTDLVPTAHFGLSSFSIDGIDGQASNWQELGAWQYRNLVAGLDALPQEVVSKVNGLVADAPNTKEKVRRIYEFMQNNTRYISVQLGIGGLRPYPANEVIEKGYGDCKGLTNLTMALLKSQGIEANYCVVWAGRHQRSIDKDFASLQGNHVILNVPLEEEELWLECTSQTMPFNFLGNFTDNRDVVALTPEGGIIKRTPNYTIDQNTLDTSGNFSLDTEGTISGTVNLVSKGIQYDIRSALLHEDQKDRISSYKSYWRYVDNLEIQSISLEEDKQEISLSEEVVISAKDFANFSNEKVIVPVNVMDRYSYIPRRYKERTQEAVLLRGGVDNTSFRIEIPDGYVVDALPSPVVIESKFGSYTLLVLPDGDKAVQVNRTLVLQNFRAATDEYKELRSFMRTVARSDAAKMVLLKQ